ncbi:arginase family protein [Candidatus Woesearchaeota archaeon]|nr:arginase family protein [Candidatus Woesearchaeota archaeon]
MYQIIKVANHLGAPHKGTDQGPDTIITSLGLKNVIEIDIPKENKRHRLGKYEKAKHLPEIKQINDALLKVIKKVVTQGDVPIILQGDDSSVIGVGYGIYQSLQEMQKVYEPFGVIYCDAHGDLNTPETTISGYLYGQGLTHLLGRGHPELLALNKHLPAVDPRHLIMIGQRNLDPGEMALIKEKKIAVFTPQKIHDSLSFIVRQITHMFKKQKITTVYIHFDQDVVDPLLSGASLCRESGGITDAEFYSFIEHIQQHFDIITLSIGNYLPSLDAQGKTLRIITKVLQLIMCSHKIR